MGDINLFKCNIGSIASLCRCRCKRCIGDDDDPVSPSSITNSGTLQRTAISSSSRQRIRDSVTEDKNKILLDSGSNKYKITAKEGEYIDYDVLAPIEADHTLINITPGGNIVGADGKSIHMVFSNIIKFPEEKNKVLNLNVNDIWNKNAYLIFYAVFKKARDGTRAQMRIEIDGEDMKVCGHPLFNKKNKVIHIVMVVKPGVTSQKDIADFLLTSSS